ncbi:hypothetical protein [Companilactobacillus nantensis]|uniref:hypothetical protein n=1 Tax=Companilactobacillus nantensis TaxID=305793 RepID=UPI00070909BB|nr:hypothetical protein [Companilactobacillus nantensis]GEO64797.1 hypothetical protein LNA01_19800 [Companilactobacillus nantensis]
MNKVEKNAIRVTSNTLNEAISYLVDDEQLILNHTSMEYSQLNLTIEMMDDLAGVLDSYRTENCIDD